ncbi:retrovirus-related pol polyprotein from transposon TNT 1-94 [Tanacetum coccineum]
MPNGSVLSKHFWTEVVRIACYTKNRSIIVKRHDKTPYEIFRERIPDISYFHVFGCPSVESIMFTNTSIDEIGIDDSSRYPPVIAPNEQDTPHTEDVEGLPDLITLKGLKNKKFRMNKSKVNPLKNLQETTLKPQWSRDQHIKLVNIIGDPGEGMLKRSMAAKLTAALASECLFVDFLSKIEPKKVPEALKHPGWVDAMQRKDEVGTVIRNKARMVAQGFSQEEGIDYDETFALVAMMEAIKIFFAFATYMNFIIFQMDIKVPS